jgi:hypothetical protein
MDDEPRGVPTGEIGAHSTARVPVISPAQSVAEARRYMVGKSFDFVDEIVVSTAAGWSASWRPAGRLPGQHGRARLAAEESISRRLWYRLPWLLAGLAGAMASAVLVGSFEAQLDEKVLLAFFLPAVVYMADAVGTQTETLLIRGMSASIDIGKVIRRELVTGVLIGVLVGLAFFPFALIGWGDADVALAVALA